MPGRTDETGLLLQAESPQSRQRVLADLFTQYRDRLRCMVQIRLDRRLKARVDPSDVLQDAFIEASQRLDGYLEKPTLPFYLWLRLLTGQRLLTLARYHTRSKRDAHHEVPLFAALPATSLGLSEHLVDGTSPSQAAMREELLARVTESLDRMDPVDREVIALRHFEWLPNGEVARVLGIDESAASKRYFRAIEKLRKVIGKIPGESRT